MESITVTGRQLAADLGISEPSVRRYLKELYDLQLVRNLSRPRQPLQLRVLADLAEEQSVSVLPSKDAVVAAWASEQTPPEGTSFPQESR
jgi:hypothetical protein